MSKKHKYIKGWVYIISNKAMPGIIKIGYSRKDPKLRAEELKHTGSPYPYVVEYEMLIENPYKIEQRIHRRLSKNKEGKEWFRCSVKDAIVAIKEIAATSIIYEQSRAGLTEEPQTIEQPPQVVGKCHQCPGDVVLKGSGKFQYVKCTRCNQVFSKPAVPVLEAMEKPGMLTTASMKKAKKDRGEKPQPVLLKPNGDRCPYPYCSGKLVSKAIGEIQYLKCSNCEKVFPK